MIDPSYMANEDISLEHNISSHKYNLFQQFFIIGFEPEIADLLINTELKNITEGPKIISKFPNIDLPYINIPDSLIISHCFPHGFKNIFLEYENNEAKEIEQTHDFFFFR